MYFISNENELANKNKMQSLYFYSSWMPFHKKMLIMIDKIEQKYKDLYFLAIDVDNFKGLCRRFNIESIPTVLIIKEGEEIKRINGLVATSAFRSVFVDIYNSETL
jgi:thioredoxin 1